MRRRRRKPKYGEVPLETAEALHGALFSLPVVPFEQSARRLVELDRFTSVSMLFSPVIDHKNSTRARAGAVLC